MEYYHRVIELKCKELSKSILSSIKEETKLFIQKENRAPGLAVILVGNNSASKSYVKSKTKRAEELGFVHFQYSLSEDSLESDVLSLMMIGSMEYSFNFRFLRLLIPIKLLQE